MNLSNVWPPLRLTAEEQQYCGYYANEQGPQDGRPGVLRRMWPVTLSATLVTGETSVLIAQFVPSGRRTRVFAMTFSGDIEWWTLELKTLSGEILIQRAPVSTLLNLQTTGGNNASFGFGISEATLSRPNNGPLFFDPNIVLTGSQTLTLTGTVEPDTVSLPGERSVLHTVFHVWEFPAWGPSGTIPETPGQTGAPAAGMAGIGGQGLGVYGPTGPQALRDANARIARQFVSRTQPMGAPVPVVTTRKPTRRK